MTTLGRDLRVLDAHAGLGHLVFDHTPKHAILHYEIGVRIGELSLPPGLDGLLPWGRIYNRAFLRCLHGYGLSRWRLGDLAGAQSVFERILSYNPNDNQGVRFCWKDVRARRTWEEAVGLETERAPGVPPHDPIEAVDLLCRRCPARVIAPYSCSSIYSGSSINSCSYRTRTDA